MPDRTLANTPPLEPIEAWDANEGRLIPFSLWMARYGAVVDDTTVLARVLLRQWEADKADALAFYEANPVPKRGKKAD